MDRNSSMSSFWIRIPGYGSLEGGTGDLERVGDGVRAVACASRFPRPRLREVRAPVLEGPRAHPLFCSHQFWVWAVFAEQKKKLPFLLHKARDRKTTTSSNITFGYSFVGSTHPTELGVVWSRSLNPCALTMVGATLFKTIWTMGLPLGNATSITFPASSALPTSLRRVYPHAKRRLVISRHAPEYWWQG